MSDLTKRMADALRVMVESDVGRYWQWPDTARESWMQNAHALLAEHDAQPERGEPVAWMLTYNGCFTYNVYQTEADAKRQKTRLDRDYRGQGTREVVALYAAPQAAVPPGFVLVPREPTEEMVQAAFDALPGYALEGNIRRHYRAMIAAAPTPGERG